MGKKKFKVKNDVKALKQELDVKVKDLLRNAETNNDMESLILRGLSYLLPRYSWKNSLLILVQNFSAREVRGYKEWERLGYGCKKGEGMVVFVPIQKKNEEQEIDNEEESTRTYFGTQYVWDISSTYIKDEKLVKKHQKERTFEFAVNSNEKAAEIFDVLIEEIRKEIPVGFESMEMSCGGYYHRLFHSITLNSNWIDPIQKLSVLVHEYAHSKLHAYGEKNMTAPRQVKEAQAETVACLVLMAFGFNVMDSSKNYIASYNKDPEIINRLGRETHLAVKQIVSMIESLETAA